MSSLPGPKMRLTQAVGQRVTRRVVPGYHSMKAVPEEWMRWMILALVAAVGAGCGVATGPEVGEEFELRVGDNAVVADADLWVAFLGVSEDSRCPLQVMCVWAGDAAVLVEAAPFPDALAADSKTDTLHTHLDPKALSLGAIELELVRLDPYPETPGSISQEQYVATFIVRRGRPGR